MKNICYIADIYCSGKGNDISYGAKISSDEEGQSVQLYYPQGEIRVSKNHLYHVTSDDETYICILRNQKVRKPEYLCEKETKKCSCRLKNGDFVVMLTKQKDCSLYEKYLAELLFLNGKRYKKQKKYMAFGDIFEKICVGDIFALICCINV